MEDKRIAAQKRAAEYNRKMIGQLYQHFKGDLPGPVCGSTQ